jgi:hypothetical protein
MSGTNADVIKEFLVSVKWQNDESAERRVTESLETIGRRFLKFGSVVEGAALGVVAAVAKIASKAEELYWASGRLGSSVQAINQFSYAISQMGGTAAGARSALEGIASFLRSSPGAGGLLTSLGISPDKLQDTVALTTELSRKFAELTRGGQYYRAKAYASVFGIDEITLQAMIRDAGAFGDEYQKMVKAVGLDQQQAGENATFFMQRLRALGTAVDLIYQKAAASLSRGLGSDLDNFRLLLLRNADVIVKAIENGARQLLYFAQVGIQFVTRFVEILRGLYDAFERLDPKSQKFILTIGAMIAAWRLLNSAFLSSPIGRIIALATALVLLFDDYQTWKNGGKSLIDWAQWEPAIEKTIAAIKEIIHYLSDAADAIGGWDVVAKAFFAYITGRWVLGIVASMTRAMGAMTMAATGGIANVGRLALALAARLGPLAAIVAGLWPSDTATDQQEREQNPGYNPAGPKIAPGAQFHDELNSGSPNLGGVPDSQAGSLENAPRPELGGMSTRIQRMAPSVFGGPGSALMREVVEFFQGRGWSAAQAAGIAANLWAESKLNTNAQGDGGAAYGIGQWHPDRQDAFRRLFNKDIRGSTLGEQLMFYDWELHNTEKSAGNQLSRANTPETAAVAVLASERPKGWTPDNPGPNAGPRAAGARSIFQGLGNAGPMVGSLSSTPPMVGTGGSSNTPVATVTGPTATINQTNNITVHGGDHNTARQIGAQLDRRNSDLIRNTRTAIS